MRTLLRPMPTTNHRRCSASVPGDEVMLFLLPSKSQVHLTPRGKKIALIEVKIRTMVAHDRSLFGFDNMFE